MLIFNRNTIAHNALDDKSKFWKLTFTSLTLAAVEMNDEVDVEVGEVLVLVNLVHALAPVATVVLVGVRASVVQEKVVHAKVVVVVVAAEVVAVVDSKASEVVVVAVM